MDVKLDEDSEEIEYVSFIGDGCAISQASASILSEQLVGMTLEELNDLETDDITDMLGVTISPMRIPCAVLGNQVAKDGAKIYQGDLAPEDYGETITEE